MDLSAYVPERISPPARYFLVASALNGLGNGVFGVVIQLYLMTLGFGSKALGSIFMMKSVGMLLLTLPAGIIADRYGMGRVFMAGTTVSWVAFTLVMTGKSIEVLSVAWFLLGLGNATGSARAPFYSSLFDSEDMDARARRQPAFHVKNNIKKILL